jgi:uncharacterized membrane protein YoaK (UPF0700 family)
MTHSVHTPARRYPLLETAPAAVALALVSGLLNAWTFGQVGTFATVQSGNLLSIGYFLADGNDGRVLLAATSVLVFAFGAFVCSIYVLWRAREDKPYSAEVLVFELVIVALLAVLTATTGISPWAVAWTVSFIAGVQGNAFHRETGMLYGNIAVTSVVQMAGEAHMRPARAYVVVLIAFVVGGGTGFGIDELWAGASLAAAAAVLLILFIAASSARGPIDPTQNNPTP